MRRPLAAALAVLVAATGAGGGAASTTVAGTPTAGRDSSPPIASGPVRDGGLEFEVRDVTRMKVVGDTSEPGYSVSARGMFVVVTLAIRNVSAAPLTFFDRYQSLVDSTGTAYGADMAADIYGNRDIRSTRMNPGAQLVVRIAFDVPTDAQARNLVLRQSESGGVTVPI
jgi:serine/threonine-protein kinase